MTIRFAIQPELDLLLYICINRIDAAQYFNAYFSAYNDPDRHHGMNVILDIGGAEMDYEPSDLKKAVDLVRVNHDAGFPPDHLALVTSSTKVMHYFTETLKLMAGDLPMFVATFHNSHDAIRWLDLGEREGAVLEFWQNFKAAG